MADRNASELLNLRLPLYAYTAPLWTGRRVLEIGCDDGGSASYLASQGADRVVVIDSDRAVIDEARVRFPHPRVEFRPATDIRQMGGLEETFDLIIVPDGKSLVGNRNLMAVLRRILSPNGHIMVSVPAADRKSPVFEDGIGYYDLVDALEGQFAVVRTLGRTPFLGFGLVEFDSAADALRVDATLLQGGTESPSHYIAIAGATAPPALGYALVQVPFSPLEAVLAGGTASALSEDVLARLAAAEEDRGRLVELTSELVLLSEQLEEAKQAVRNAPKANPAPAAIAGLDAMAAITRSELAERRLDEAEQRARARLDEADTRAFDLRRKLDEALVQSESAVRVSRAQADEIDELRGRLRRASEDRQATDSEMVKLRRALSEADASVLALTRKTAEEMASVAQRIATGLRASTESDGLRERQTEIASLRDEIERLRSRLSESEGRVRISQQASEVSTTGALQQIVSADVDERLRRAEESASRERAEVAEMTERLRVADEQIRSLKQRAALVGERDDRIARLEGDKQDLIWRAAELEEKLRVATSEAKTERPIADEVQSAREGRDRAIEEFHRAAAAHVSEVNRLRSSVDEQAALVVELEDALRVSEARAAAADKDATALRRNAKELEEADRTRRGRLAELEGKLLRFEREKAMAGATVVGAGAADGEVEQKLRSFEQRALAAEQRAVGSDERLALAQRRATDAEQRLSATEERLKEASGRISDMEQALEESQRQARVVSVPTVVLATSANEELVVLQASVGVPSPNGTSTSSGSPELQVAIEEVEQQLRHELRMLAAIEETLVRARDEVARSIQSGDKVGGPASDLERAVAQKDAQLIEGRLELARLRRESESRQAQLEREIAELRSKLNPFGQRQDDHSQSAQLILMHTTLANIRRRAARLRDELEGFRRRLDSLPPGALSSMLEEIGEDLGEFAK